DSGTRRASALQNRSRATDVRQLQVEHCSFGRARIGVKLAVGNGQSDGCRSQGVWSSGGWRQRENVTIGVEGAVIDGGSGRGAKVVIGGHSDVFAQRDGSPGAWIIDGGAVLRCLSEVVGRGAGDVIAEVKNARVAGAGLAEE